MKVVAEVGLQHCGCLGTAFAFVDAIADAGADVAKFQDHGLDPCSSFRPGMENYFVQDADRQAYWHRTSFGFDQWRKLADKCHKRGLQFACSCFSVEGIEAMSTIVDILKVPSSKTHDAEFLRAAAATGKPVVLSTGMSTNQEIKLAMMELFASGTEPESITLLQCTSEYPCPPEHIGINQVLELEAGWAPCKTGLSDHSGSIWPGVMAAAQVCDMLELHVTWSKKAWGPDVSSSLTIEQLAQLVEGVRYIETLQRSPVSRDELAKELEPVRRVFRGA